MSYLDSRVDISYKELLALKKGLRFFEGKLHDVIQWRVDNESARLAILNEGSSGSQSLKLLALDILKFCQHLGIQIQPSPLFRGRREISQDWALRQDVADSIFQAFGQPDIDMMATRESSKTERFCAEGIDSLSPSVSWEKIGFPYVFPPPSLINKVLDKIVQAKIEEAIVITPWWYSKNKTWFPKLRNMTIDRRRLPLLKDLVRDLSGPETSINFLHLKLVASKVTGNDRYRRIRQYRCNRELRGLGTDESFLRYRQIPSL